MEKFKRKNLIRITVLTSLSIFSLFAVFSGTIAWFNCQRAFSADQDNFAIDRLDGGVAAISVYNFLGSTSDGEAYGFDPTPDHSIVWTDQSGTDSTGFEMGMFSLTDPHHPVLFLMTLSSSHAVVRLKTDYPYLAKTKPGVSPTVYPTFSAYLSAGGKSSGYYEITSDERQNAYYSDQGSSVKVATQYHYDAVSGESTLEWVDLGQFHNPLSSIIECHYVLFAGDPSASSVTGDLTKGGVTSEQEYFAIQKSDVESNEASFVEFDASGNPVYQSDTTIFDDDASGYTHLGVIIDYSVESLEYIYSYFLGHSFLNEGLGFKCDFRMEI